MAVRPVSAAIRFDTRSPWHPAAVPVPSLYLGSEGSHAMSPTAPITVDSSGAFTRGEALLAAASKLGAASPSSPSTSAAAPSPSAFRPRPTCRLPSATYGPGPGAAVSSPSRGRRGQYEPERAVNPLGRHTPDRDHGGVTDVRVLVVDDQDAYRRAMGAVVAETPGFVVVGSVATGEESLVAAAELEPDLVLMDVNLPGIDGVEAAARLSQGPVVVLLSTYDEDEFESTGCGAAAYVSKAAFSPERLQQVWQDATSAR